MKRSPTNFEQRVYDLVCRVPRGKVVTYSAMARALGCGSAQAIGQALKRNPMAPEVPCHRVIKTDLTVGGYVGQTDGPVFNKKRSLLRDEGVKFGGDGKLVDARRVLCFEDAEGASAGGLGSW